MLIRRWSNGGLVFCRKRIALNAVIFFFIILSWEDSATAQKFLGILERNLLIVFSGWRRSRVYRSAGRSLHALAIYETILGEDGNRSGSLLSFNGYIFLSNDY